MKNLKIIFIVFSVLTITACQKETTSLFTTDKEVYNAGETIHCINESGDFYSWKWTTPGGKTVISRNLDFATDSADRSGTKTFTLEVGTQKGKKKDVYSKSVIMNELILPTDYFSVGSTIYIPATKVCEPNSGIYWKIDASIGSGPHCFNDLLIVFSGTTPPVVGTYVLQSSFPTTPGTAYVQVGAPTGIECTGVQWYVSNYGELTVSITSNGKIRVVFDNVPTAASTISGDITCH